ncbi:MAG: hypothetical protein ACOX6Y_08940 [Christensenellales bacterium]
MLTRVVVGGRKKKKALGIFFFLALPLMLLVIAFAYVPLAGWYFALIEYRVGTPIFQCEFVGLANFARLFSHTGLHCAPSAIR